jgi:hypothetical protein
MRTYRYRWRHRDAFLTDLRVLYLDVPALGLKIEITRHQPGWYHWLRIRRGDETFPVCMLTGPISYVFETIRLFVSQELANRMESP